MEEVVKGMSIIGSKLGTIIIHIKKFRARLEKY
jgi:hypothetical protein